MKRQEPTSAGVELLITRTLAPTRCTEFVPLGISEGQVGVVLCKSILIVECLTTKEA